MRILLLCIFVLCFATGHAGQDVSTANNQSGKEVCRDALFPLAGIAPTGRFDTKEGLYLCLTNPGTPAVAYQVYVNGKKSFQVTPDEAKNFNVYISNTYSFRCTDPRERVGVKNSTALPKLNTRIKIDTSNPMCVVATEINGVPVRAAFVFDDIDRAPAIFEVTQEEMKKHKSLESAAADSGCTRNFNRDGTPSPCLEQHWKDKQECPSAELSCFDPALAGAWLQTPKLALETIQAIPRVNGWVIHQNGDVNPLAVDFKNGALVEGKKVTHFSRVSYGCNGELYQVTHGFAEGSTGLYCGRYTIDGKILGIAIDKSALFEYYEPAFLGTKYMAPVHFTFAATLGEQSVSIPHVATSLPAFVLAEVSSVRHRAVLFVNGDSDSIRISLPDLSHATKLNGKSAGTVSISINNSHRTIISKDDPDHPNEIAIDDFDIGKGRVSGVFSYAVADGIKSMRFEGRFDLPLYIRNTKISK